MITLKNITKKYDHVVLNQVNLSLEKGKIYVLKGISGSGKTTLFNLLAGLDSNYEGEYLWDGKDVKKMTVSEQIDVTNRLSYVFQKSYLFRGLTVLENLLFIRDDVSLIEKYAKEFQVSHLLSKRAEQLSGGEKQRISLIRALLLDSEVILLDEPTSSLDSHNSQLFVSFLQKIPKENKIIVIATHKDIYDELSDEIVHIDYGKVTVEKNSQKVPNDSFHARDKEKKKSTWKLDFMFSFKRKKKRIALLIFAFIFFFFTMIGVSLLVNFKREYLKQKWEFYPLHILSIYQSDQEDLESIIDQVYLNYQIEEEGYRAYILLEEEDTVFHNPTVLKYGRYPRQEQEVLVNEEFVREKFPSVEYSDAIGQKIVLADETFTISGVIHCGEYDGYYVYETVSFYKEIDALWKNYISPAVFVPYSKMEKIGTVKEKEEEVVISISKEVALDFYLQGDSLEEGIIHYSLPWANLFSNEYSTLEYCLHLVSLIFAFVLFFVFLFVTNKITLELSYRQREFGYLQLFRVRKKRIFRIYLMDYLWEIVLAFLSSFLCYLLLCCFLLFHFHLNFFLPIPAISLLLLCFSVYFYFLIKIPLNRYLKKDILSLISNVTM